MQIPSALVILWGTSMTARPTPQIGSSHMPLFTLLGCVQGPKRQARG